MDALIEDNKTEIYRICEKNNVKSLYFFGSIIDARKFRSDSDVDILVSFRDDISNEAYTDSYFGLLFELEELLNREIDITTIRSVTKAYFKKELEETRVLFYDALTEVDG
ncbi:MAG: nucleotidyltransferase domain-containing protein [Bacteroidetes bacterium]|jgi:predicted nucleotidyltransferase|nr:nucleotidyltransferase domain-containing protein [Bacteroidota bacterium]